MAWVVSWPESEVASAQPSHGIWRVRQASVIGYKKSGKPGKAGASPRRAIPRTTRLALTLRSEETGGVTDRSAVDFSTNTQLGLGQLS